MGEVDCELHEIVIHFVHVIFVTHQQNLFCFEIGTFYFRPYLLFGGLLGFFPREKHSRNRYRWLGMMRKKELHPELTVRSPSNTKEAKRKRRVCFCLRQETFYIRNIQQNGFRTATLFT